MHALRNKKQSDVFPIYSFSILWMYMCMDLHLKRKYFPMVWSFSKCTRWILKNRWLNIMGIDKKTMFGLKI